MFKEVATVKCGIGLFLKSNLLHWYC